MLTFCACVALYLILATPLAIFMGHLLADASAQLRKEIGDE